MRKLLSSLAMVLTCATAAVPVLVPNPTLAADFTTPIALTNVLIHDAKHIAGVRGTIVMADGSIIAVGDDVTIPRGAEVIAADTLHAYPAFIDALSHYGIPDTKRTKAQRQRVEDRNPDPAQGPMSETRLANRRGILPEFSARDVLAPDADAIEAYHRAGFGLTLTAPRYGIVGGACALTTITDLPIRRAILREDVGQYGSFVAGEPGIYPRTALGATATFRQFVLDARWYNQFERYLERHPRAPQRLPADKALETMNDFLHSDRPLIFQADLEREIHWALDLADEFNLRIWISGGREAYKIVDRLKEKHVPVLVSLKLPEEPAYGKKDGGKKQDEERDQELARYEPERLRAERRRLWNEKLANLQTLAEAGITVAVSSDGLDKPGELLANLRQAIEAGLPVETALAALTTNPAQLLNETRRLGTLSPGALANIVLFDAPFETKDAQVKEVFIEGQRFSYTDEEKEDEADEKDEKEDKELTTNTSPKDETDAKAVATQEMPADIATTGIKESPSETASPPAPLADWLVELEADRQPQIHTGGNVLITGATIITVSGETLSKGSILVENGKIVEIGTKVRKPAGIAVIDANGLFAMPGIIDCHSHMAIAAINEGTLSVTAEVRVGDVIDPRQVAIYRALAGGVTTIHTMHGSANTIGGQNAILKLRYGQNPAQMRFAGAPRTIKFALGENVTHKNSPQQGKRFPNTRMGVESVLRQALIAANEYNQARVEHEQARAEGRDLPPLRRDLREEALADVLAGKLWVHCHGYRGDEYLRLIAVAEDFGFRIAVLQHVLEGYRIMPEIARHGSGASTFSNDWAYKIEAISGIPYNAAMLARYGINTSLNSDSPNTIRFMTVEAAKSVRWGGLSDTQALKLITLNPAQQLGIANRVGSLEPGKDADIALFDGPPLDTFSQCTMTLIDGEVYFQDPRSQRAEQAQPIVPAPQDLKTVPRGEHALYAIINATVHPISGPAIPSGTVLIRNERIDEVGVGVTIPPGAVIIDARGMHVYPGLIDAGSVLGLSEVLMARQTQDANEIARLEPELRAASAIHPYSVHFGVARSSGITTAVVRPGGGWLSGRSAVVDLAGWSTDEMLRGGDFALHVTLPYLPARLPEKDRDKEKKAFAKQMKEIEDFLRQAKHYAHVQQTGADRRPTRDLRLEAMIPFVRGEKPVVFTANNHKHILDSIDFAKKHNLRCIISGGSEAWKCADRLAADGIPVILSSVTNYPTSRFEPFDSVFACAAKLDQAGVAYCFATGQAAEAYNLPIQAGLAVAYGLDPQRAIRALTLGAAEILGMEKEIGSLEPGKIANLIVTSDTPIQTKAGVAYMFIRGQPVDMSNIHTNNRDRFDNRPTPALAPPKELVGPPSLTTLTANH